MKHAATRQLYDYWNTLRGERASPERSEIDPAAIRDVLANTFILDVEANGIYPFRLSGTRTNALFTTDLRGRSFVSLWLPRERAGLERLLAAISDDATGVVAGVEASFAGREPMTLELLLLPVRYFGRTHARILGCLSPAALPRWMGLVPPDHLRLASVRMLATSTGRGAARPASSFFGDRAAALRRADQPRRRGPFFVYDGGADPRLRRRASELMDR